MTGDATRTGTTMTTWPDLLSLLLRGEDLPPEDTRWAMDRVMAGEATPVQVAGFLVALRAKGETVAELRALADECRSRYAHAFLCDTDLPHEQDGWRANTEVRAVQQAFIRQDLEARGVQFTLLRGSVPERVAQVRTVLGDE